MSTKGLPRGRGPIDPPQDMEDIAIRILHNRTVARRTILTQAEEKMILDLFLKGHSAYHD